MLVPFRHSFANTDAGSRPVAGVVAVAVLGNRLGGWLAAISAGIWFDFFRDPKPYEHFSITSRTDIETTLLLFVVGGGVTESPCGAVVSRRGPAAGGRPCPAASAVEVVAAGGSPTELADRVGQLLRNSRPTKAPLPFRHRPG